MDFRKSYGEDITDESPLMRDIWQTSNVKHGAKWGLATKPNPLKTNAILKILNRAVWEQGLRKPLPEGVRHHEWKVSHGFRKYYTTNANQAIPRTLNVDLLLGHDIGLSESYHKPTQDQLLEDYLLAVDVLTINDYSTTFQKQVTELVERNEEQSYIIKAKLAEKEKEAEHTKKDFELLKREQEILTKTMESLVKVITGQSDTLTIYPNIDDPETLIILKQMAREQQQEEKAKQIQT